MTPAELNAVMVNVHVHLDEKVLPRMAASYERILRSQGRVIARRMRERAHSLIAAFVPPDEDEVIDADKLAEKITRQNAKERRAAAEAIRDALAAHDIAWDIHGNFTPDMLEAVGARATFAVEQELREVYRGTITEAFEQGWSIPRTSSAIVSNVDGVAAYRATALARTDLIGLANGASQDAAVDAFGEREDVTKIWLATADERTRDTHVEADGQEVPLNQPFDVDGFPLMYPGDPDGPDEEVINCRCTLIYGSAEAEAAAVEEGLPGEGEASFAHAVGQGVYSPLLMPWHVESKHDECPDGKPFAVIKDSDGSVAGCHPTRAAANKQMAALYAKEGDMDSTMNEVLEDDEVMQRTPWEGILAIEGHPTSDGRYLIPGEIEYRELPLPIAASHESQHETKTVGRIEAITNIPISEFDAEDWNLPEMAPHAAVIWGEGTFDGSEDAEDALRQLENGVGISLDLPTERQAIIDASTYEEVDPSALSEEEMLAIAMGMIPEGYLRGFAGKIGGASLASIAAFEESRIRLIDNVALVASGYAIRERQPKNTGVSFYAAGLKQMVASAAPVAPPRDWFFVEEPDEPTPLTILPNGQIYGHLALWNTCHVGRMNGAFSSCMYAPHSPTNYSQFHLGAMLCEDGTEIPIGRLTIGTGHAPLHLGAAAARAHYDNTGTVVGFVRAKDGVFGIWLSGVQKSDATEEQIRDLRACPPSGDWRNHDHALELQAALAVNSAGFPVPRSQLALAASGEGLEVGTLILGAPDQEDFAESLRAEYALTDEENVAILFDLDEPAPAA